MAAFSNPFASNAVAGVTIFKPGVEANHDSGFTEWKIDVFGAQPDGSLKTTGRGPVPRTVCVAA